MGKPSIFSREYEKRMKKRKKNTIVILVLMIIVISATVLKFTYNPIDFSQIKQNMQAWIDSDPKMTAESSEEQEQEQEIKEKEDTTKVEKEEVSKEPQEKNVDITLKSGKVAKAVYIENENGEKVFKDLKDIDSGVTFDISASGKQILVCDTNSQITIYNVDGSSKIASKDQYVSTSGTVFNKDNVLSSEPGYLWNYNPKFVNEENIVFITARPYFGSAAKKQYLWMTNINNQTDKIFWELAAQKIEIENKEENKIKITIDGITRYIGEDGNIV